MDTVATCHPICDADQPFGTCRSAASSVAPRRRATSRSFADANASRRRRTRVMARLGSVHSGLIVTSSRKMTAQACRAWCAVPAQPQDLRQQLTTSIGCDVAVHPARQLHLQRRRPRSPRRRTTPARPTRFHVQRDDWLTVAVLMPSCTCRTRIRRRQRGTRSTPFGRHLGLNLVADAIASTRRIRDISRLHSPCRTLRRPPSSGTARA